MSMCRAAAVLIAVLALGSATAVTEAGAAQAGRPATLACPPSARAVDYSDALDKLSYDGVVLGGLSSLAYDRRAGAWVSAVDNHLSDPARIWFFRDLANPHVIRDPLVLRTPDGTPYDGMNSDNEGLAVLPDGDYLVSSETEPAIRIFGRDGVQRASLPVPASFAVAGTTPDGQASPNATLEGLTITPSGHTIVAAMEGALSGDTSSSGDATYHRFLVYTDRHGSWRLTKQLGYRAETGARIPEVAAYQEGSLLVEEASYAPTTGNAVALYAVTAMRHAPDVSDVDNLSDDPSAVVSKRLITDLARCPTLGAPAKETQANPLLDNFEGMAVTGRRASGRYGISLISDDNFNALQTTRVLNLVATLP